MYYTTALLAALASTFAVAIPLNSNTTLDVYHRVPQHRTLSDLYRRIPSDPSDTTEDLPEVLGEDETPLPHVPDTTPSVLSRLSRRERERQPWEAPKSDCDGCCPERRFHYPRKSQYEVGYKQFCRNWIEESGTQIWLDTPLVVTMTLNGNDSRDIKWIFKINLEENSPRPRELRYAFIVKRDECNKRFKSVLEGAAGEMPKASCWLWGKLLVMGGTTYDHFPNTDIIGRGVFETRQKNGDEPKAQY
jgi:hypothetical protein